MNRRLFNLFATGLLLVAVAFIGCSKDGNPAGPGGGGPGGNGVLVPLALGNKWDYEYIYYEDSVEVYRGADTCSIYFTLDRGAFTWFGRCDLLGASDRIARNTADGLWILLDTEIPSGALVYHYPANAGGSWAVGDPTHEVTLVSVTATVSVPAGTFANCYQYLSLSSYSPVHSLTEWFKPGVGLVRSVSTTLDAHNEPQSGRYEVNLMSCQVQ